MREGGEGGREGDEEGERVGGIFATWGGRPHKDKKKVSDRL